MKYMADNFFFLQLIRCLYVLFALLCRRFFSLMQWHLFISASVAFDFCEIAKKPMPRLMSGKASVWSFRIL